MSLGRLLGSINIEEMTVILDSSQIHAETEWGIYHDDLPCFLSSFSFSSTWSCRRYVGLYSVFGIFNPQPGPDFLNKRVQARFPWCVNR